MDEIIFVLQRGEALQHGHDPIEGILHWVS